MLGFPLLALIAWLGAFASAQAAESAPAPFAAGVQVYGPLHIEEVLERVSPSDPNHHARWRLHCDHQHDRWTYLLPSAIDDFSQLPRHMLAAAGGHFRLCTAPTGDAMSTSQQYAAFVLIRHRGIHSNDPSKAHIYLYFSRSAGAAKFEDFRQALGAHYRQ